MTRLNPEIKNLLKSIDISHLFAQSLDHGVSYAHSNWELFEPSKFIYSFFAFNMLYDVDWDVTFKRPNRDLPWNYSYGTTTADKIKLLLDFIYSKNDTISFIDFYSKYDKGFKLKANSNGIKLDKNINRKDKSNFLPIEDSYLNNYKSALFKIDNIDFNIDDHYKSVIFCYQIRNNVFHGLKKASEMRKSGQRERLLDYSYIILTTIDMFFHVVMKEYNYHPATQDELRENAGFISYN